MKRIFFLFFILVIVFCLKSAQAQTTGIVLGSNVPVYEQPNPKSELLVEMEKGKKISVLGRKPGWLKVKVQLDKNFSFTGWVNEKMVSYKTPAAKSKAPVAAAPMAPAMAPAPAMQPQTFAPPPAAAPPPPKSELDQFFAPVTQAPAESGTVAQPFTVKKKSSTTREPKVFHFSDRGSLSAGLGYVLYHYSLSSRGGATPSEIFAYNLPGFGIDLDADYKYWTNEDGKLFAKGELAFQYGLYRFSTNLQDSSGTTFGTVNSNTTSYDVILKFPLEYRFSSETSPLAVGGSVGFEYLRFSADDVESDTAPLNLYVSQTTMSGLISAYAHFPIPIPNFPGVLVGSVGTDIMVFSMVSENPSDATGTSPSAKIGFKPELKVSWLPWDRQYFDLGYRLRVQGYTFTGTGSRVGTDNVTDGKVDTVIHEFFLGYEYHFK